MHTSEPTAAGIHALPGQSSSFASTQAAWRFLHNPAITLPMLAAPLLNLARTQAARHVQDYALIVHDWSLLSYPKHRAKADRLQLDAHMQGYDLYTALLLSDRTGGVLAPLHQALASTAGTLTSQTSEILTAGTHQQQIDRAVSAVEKIDVGGRQLHIIDRGLDAVEYFRRWQQQEFLFLVRVNAKRLVLYNERECLLSDVLADLTKNDSFLSSTQVEYKGRRLQQIVAEASVTLHRPARRRIAGKPSSWGGRQSIAGEAIALRLIVARLCDDQQQVVAEWLLLSNLPESVSAERIVEFYYWRWRIESFFKLLKSAGHQLEHWQQQSAEAIARRLLVASMACALVWQLARDTSEEAVTARQVLVRLSGRQMRWGRSWTEPALLAGMWTLLAMLDTLEHHQLGELQALAQRLFSTMPP